MEYELSSQETCDHIRFTGNKSVKIFIGSGKYIRIPNRPSSGLLIFALSWLKIQAIAYRNYKIFTGKLILKNIIRLIPSPMPNMFHIS